MAGKIDLSAIDDPQLRKDVEEALKLGSALHEHMWYFKGFDVRLENSIYVVERRDGDRTENNRCTTPDDVDAYIEAWKPSDPIYTFELNVPSGKMIVANDLRRDWPVVGDYDINSNYGCRLTSLQYAERAGMAHAFVGNTCPGVFKLSETEFAIGVGGHDSRGREVTKPVKGRKVGSICTDLWWYSIVDYADFVRRLGKPADKHGLLDVVVCKPGVYQFRHLFHALKAHEDPRPLVFTEIKWVREPDPVRDYRAEYDTLDFTAEQVVADMLKGPYCSIYGGSVRRAADQLMCVLGSGMEYHKNGWRGGSPYLKVGAPGVEIPEFHGQHHWYPLYESSFLVLAAQDGDEPRDTRSGLAPKDIRLNESFVRLAFNILYNIVKYGVIEKDDQFRESTMQFAKKALHGFVEKYPTQVPERVRALVGGVP